MKAVILAGGRGTRILEESVTKPKPMIEIGGKPILWHIMKHYSAHGIDDFVICLGYKGYVIKEYFANYYLHSCDITFDIARNSMEVHHSAAEPWRVTLADTGETTMTGGRLKRAMRYLDSGEDFCFTYGDGLSDVDLKAVIDYHRSQRVTATVTAVQPPGRFGALELDGSRVQGFAEKLPGDGGWINGGFFVLSPDVGDYLEDDATVWELEPMRRLAQEGRLAAHFHHGFWQPMDTLRDHQQLDALWQEGRAPWNTWSQ